MPQSDPSKTEKATPKRRKKSRDEGNVAKSQEVTKALSIIAALVGFYFWFGVIYEQLNIIFSHFFGRAIPMEVSPEVTYRLFVWLAQEVAIMVVPLLLFFGFVAFLGMRLQVGKLWTTKVFMPKLSKFNPISGFKRLFFSAQTLIRLGKSLLQAFFIGIAPYLVIRSEMDNFLPLYYADALGVSVYILTIAKKMVIYALLPMVVIAIADTWYTFWDYEENIKMTKDEVKDEARQMEGDPKIKAEQKKKMMEVMMNRMLQDVPKADVVITNPTHIAVALRYDAMEAPAPQVLAIGADHIAEKIKEVARENNVPLRQNVPLARALYKACEVGDLIPEELYKAVAGILATLHGFRAKAGG